MGGGRSTWQQLFLPWAFPCPGHHLAHCTDQMWAKLNQGRTCSVCSAYPVGFLDLLLQRCHPCCQVPSIGHLCRLVCQICRFLRAGLGGAGPQAQSKALALALRTAGETAAQFSPALLLLRNLEALASSASGESTHSGGVLMQAHCSACLMSHKQECLLRCRLLIISVTAMGAVPSHRWSSALDGCRCGFDRWPSEGL